MIGTANVGVQQMTPALNDPAALLAALANVRAARPDLADWCDRVPAVAALFCTAPWAARWAALPDAAQGTATLLTAWADADHGTVRPLPDALAALAEAQTLAAHGVCAWPPASAEPALVARCLIGLSATPAVVIRSLADSNDTHALAAALDERAARALDAAVLLAGLPAPALATLLEAAAAAAHPAVPQILDAARSAGSGSPDQGAAMVAGLLQQDPTAACALAEATAAAWPDHLGARLALARAYNAVGKHSSAAPLLVAALAELDCTSAACAAELAAAEDALGRPAQARTAWARALARNPALGRAAVWLACRARAAGRGVSAERMLAATIARGQPAELPALLPELYDAGFVAPLRAALARAQAALPDDPAVAYYTALLHQRDCDLSEARAGLGRAIVLAPRWAAPRVALADLLHAQGQWVEAATEYLVVLQRDPTCASALAGLSDLRARQGDLPAAIALAETLVRAAPEAASHHARLADLLLAAGRAAEALPAAQAAAARGTSADHAARLARAQLETGATSQALATLQSARADFGDHPTIVAMLAATAESAHDWAVALEAQTAQFLQLRDARSARAAAQAARALGNLALARAWFARALRCAPTESAIWVEVAAIHRDTARPRAAVRAYTRALRAGAPLSTQRGLAHAYVQAGDLPAAIACLEGYLATAEQDTIAWHLLGRIRQHQGDRAGTLDAAERLADLPDVPAAIASWMIDTLVAAGLRGRAREAADAAVAAAPHDAALRVRRAGLLLDAGAIAEARADAIAALTRQRDLVPARIILARIQLREAAYTTARATLAPLVDDPHHADVVGPLLAEALEGCGVAVEALPYAKRALQCAPADRVRRARLARLLLATGQPQHAAALLQGAQDQPELIILRAQAAAALGQYEAAQRDAQAAARLAPDDAAIALVAATLAGADLAPASARQHWMALTKRFPGDDAIRQRAAQGLLAADDAPAAIALLRPLVEHAAASAETAGLLGCAYVRAGRIQDGVRTLRYAVRNASDAAQRAEWQLALAEAYATLGWADDARATLDILLEEVPAHVAARRIRARLAIDAANLADAEADLAVIAEDDPETAELRAALATRKGDWAGALAAQRQACALAPSPERLTRLAEIGAAAGDGPAQIAALEALTQHSSAPNHWAALAEAHAAAGNRQAARAAWQQALNDAAPAAWWAALGRLAQADGDTTAAQTAFGRALASDPADTTSATALADLSDIPSQRVELLRQATQHAPRDAALWLHLAQALAIIGASAEARQALQQACGLAPDDSEVALAYADALLAAGERLSAVEVLERACATADAPAHLIARLAAVLTEGLPFIGDLVRLPAAPEPARQRLTARAETLLAQACERDPLTPAWRLQAARLALVTGDQSSARGLLAELAWDQLDASERSTALALRAVALARGGELQDAAADARQVLDGPELAAMHAILAEAALATGAADLARTHARAARTAGADSPALLATLGQAALALGHAGEACEALELALEQGTEASWLHALSRAYGQLGRRERALDFAARAVRVAPNVASYQHQLATLYQQQRQLHDARAALIRALSLQPDMAVWHAQMAEICDALGMAQAAAQSLAHARSLAPNDPAIMVIGAQLRVAQGDTIGALADYRQALADAPDRVEWHVAAAELARTSQQNADFLKHARAAVEQAPDQSAHWQLLAEAVEATRDETAALAVLEEGLAHCRGDRNLTLRAAEMGLTLNQPARAQALLDAWLDQMPDDAEACELAGLAAQALGDADAARRAFERAVRITPRRASTHAALARLALAVDDSAAALQAAANASDYDPMHRGHAVLLARALQAAQRTDEARSIIRPILPEALPNDAELCRWYAELQLLDGDPGRAIAALEQAIGRAPDVPELHLWAGRAHRQLRHYRRAITHLRRAIRLRPSYPEAIIELSSLGPLAFAAHAAKGDGADEMLSECVA